MLAGVEEFFCEIGLGLQRPAQRCRLDELRPRADDGDNAMGHKEKAQQEWDSR
jgi:hypothetical protein